MKSAYPKVHRLAKLDGAQFQRDLEALCYARAGELLQAYVEAEVDDLLERARYERLPSDNYPDLSATTILAGPERW